MGTEDSFPEDEATGAVHSVLGNFCSRFRAIKCRRNQVRKKGTKGHEETKQKHTINKLRDE
jgi:hypothetical protein